MSARESDVTRLPDLLHGTARAGASRTRRPVYLDLLPPCNAGCPAGENIQGWLAHAREGKHEQAWRKLVADNPLPAIHGRVCYHPCESTCNRGEIDGAVSIHAVERFLGDLARERAGSSTLPRRGAASECSSSAAVRAGSRLPTISPDSATRWRSVTTAASRAG